MSNMNSETIDGGRFALIFRVFYFNVSTKFCPAKMHPGSFVVNRAPTNQQLFSSIGTRHAKHKPIAPIG